MAFGTDSKLVVPLLTIASILGLIQLIGSIWSVTARWDDNFGYALEARSANRLLFEKYRALAESPPRTDKEATTQYSLIESECNARTNEDEKQSISEDEKRMGMRAALRQLRKQCAGCGNVPSSMEPTECDVCGKFPTWRF